MNNTTDNIPELKSPFEQLREVDAEGREWWNSRKLARVMGYGKYWNFERVIAKAQAWVSQKGYHLSEHFTEFTEMAELGSGAVRAVVSVRLSRTACIRHQHLLAVTAADGRAVRSVAAGYKLSSAADRVER